MTLVILVGLVVFFLAGYKLHHYQYEELVAEATVLAKEAVRRQEEAKEMCNMTKQSKQRLEEQMVALRSDEQDRFKNHASIVHENEFLKNQLLILQRKCTCGGIKKDGSN